MKLEEKLVALRKAKGLSQLKLAEMMDVSRQAISRWETGASVPTTENLKCLSRLYDVSLDYLVNDGVDEPERETERTEGPEEKLRLMPEAAEKKCVKRKAVKWLIMAICLVGLIAAIYIGTKDRKQDDIVPINDVEKKEVESETGPGFDFVW